LTKHNTLSVFSELYGDVDWYVGFVDTGTVTISQLTADFQCKNLIAALLLDPSDYPLHESHEAVVRWSAFHTAYWRLAWIDYHLGKRKRQHEHSTGTYYDNMLFIRPDSWYYLHPSVVAQVRCQLDVLTVSEIGSSGNTADDWTNGDMIHRAGAAAGDLLTLRYIDPHFTDHLSNQLVHGNSHVNLACYQPRRLIGFAPEFSGIDQCIIRPDHMDLMPFDTAKVDPNFRDSRTWSYRNRDDKLYYCHRLGISPQDYQL
jgi:hypothetical protein